MAITFTPQSGAIGADVHGVDLTQPLDAATVDTIRNGLLEHLVLFFREQKILSMDEHLRLGGYFGDIEPTPFRRPGDPDLVLMLDQMDGKNEGANFHADNTFRQSPPLGALLQAHQLPSKGGDTCFASMYAAFEALSPRMQAFLDGLEAYHSLAQMAQRLAGSGVNLAFDLDAYPPIKHPVVAVHPETGRKLLNVNFNWTTHIDGLPRDESVTILRFLYEHVKRAEFQARLKWNVGDVAFWDNRSCQHYAVPDYNERRKMQRVSLLTRQAAEARAAA